MGNLIFICFLKLISRTRLISPMGHIGRMRLIRPNPAGILFLLLIISQIDEAPMILLYLLTL